MTDKRAKAANLIHRGIGCVEFFDFTGAQMANLQNTIDAMAKEGRKRFSFHSPINRPDYFPYSGVSCFFLCEDEEKRQLSFRLLDHTMQQARKWGGQYVVSHLTFGPTDTRDEKTAVRLAADSCRRIAKMSREHAMPVDLEFAAYSAAFNDTGVFADIVGEHHELAICIDIGHAFIGALKRKRDYMQDIRAMAPKTRSMHLWNSMGEEHTKKHHHTPLHPSQNPQDGWIDVEETIKLVLDNNPETNIIFEYPISEMTPEIQQGYDWIGKIVSEAV